MLSGKYITYIKNKIISFFVFVSLLFSYRNSLYLVNLFYKLNRTMAHTVLVDFIIFGKKFCRALIYRNLEECENHNSTESDDRNCDMSSTGI